VGDLAGRNARRTIDATGLYIVPFHPPGPTAGRGTPAFGTGTAAHFHLSRDPEGRDVVWTLAGDIDPAQPAPCARRATPRPRHRLDVRGAQHGRTADRGAEHGARAGAEGAVVRGAAADAAGAGPHTPAAALGAARHGRMARRRLQCGRPDDDRRAAAPGRPRPARGVSERSGLCRARRGTPAYRRAFEAQRAVFEASAPG